MLASTSTHMTNVSVRRAAQRVSFKGLKGQSRRCHTGLTTKASSVDLSDGGASSRRRSLLTGIASIPVSMAIATATPQPALAGGGFTEGTEEFVNDTRALMAMLDKLFNGKGDDIKYADFVALADPWENNYKYAHKGYGGVWLVMLKAKLAASVQFKKSGALDDPNVVYKWQPEETIYNNDTVLGYLKKADDFFASECGDACIKPFSV